MGEPISLGTSHINSPPVLRIEISSILHPPPLDLRNTRSLALVLELFGSELA